jgi:2-iminoacetate synthase ThiH
MGVEELETMVAPLGRPLVQRSTLYALAGTASAS